MPLVVFWIKERPNLDAKTSRTTLLVWRLATYKCPPSDRTSRGVPAPHGAWRQGVLHQAIDLKTVRLDGAWRMATRLFRQAICTGFAWWRLGRARR